MKFPQNSPIPHWSQITSILNEISSSKLKFSNLYCFICYAKLKVGGVGLVSEIIREM